MSIRSAASCSQPRQDSSAPRGARTGRGPDMALSLLPQAGHEQVAEPPRADRGDRDDDVVTEGRVVGLGATVARADEDVAPTDRCSSVAATPPAGSQAAWS